ncbi:camp-regulated phosphoprotein/endosulfine conserved region-domain-containing protein [Penicillium hetheringtonii]|uniref:mRNA stability protein n=1 Tax=Penicillium hetheringtonii TaxID=911720 RepID=A0AAD6GLR2_9EURO|nr:camp-regulated phosphoprotein/endosulfine conserved region-domain-containing protein [Penicillium hetheringtonii]
MNPHQQNKVDISAMSSDEQRLFRLYGKMPNKKDLLQNKLKERKYFDSGDYALSKAGKASDVTSIGSRHPVPENIPHLTATSPGANNPTAATGNGGSVNTTGQQLPGSISGHPGSVGFQSRSPAKEGFLQRGSSLSEGSAGPNETEDKDPSVSPPPTREGVPIQR